MTLDGSLAPEIMGQDDSLGSESEGIKGDLDVLNQEDGEDQDGGQDQEPDTDEPNTDEESDKELEPEVDEEPDPEVDANVLPGRPTFKELKAEFPEIFKKFPGLRDMVINESQYAREFPTVDEARAGKQRLELVQEFERKLESGDSELLLKGLKQGDKLDAFADNFLNTLEKVDQKAYLRNVTPIFISVINRIRQQGELAKNKNLIGTSQLLSHFLFGSYDVPKDALAQFQPDKQKQEDPELVRVKTELEKRDQMAWDGFQEDIIQAGTHEIRRAAGVGLDPKGSYSKDHREAILDKIMSEVNHKLAQDARHNREMDALWQQARRTGLNDANKAKILQTYLSRAKPVLQVIKARYISGPLKTPPQGKVPINRSVPGSNNGKPVSAKQVDWTKTSDEDFLADRVTLRK